MNTSLKAPRHPENPSMNSTAPRIIIIMAGLANTSPTPNSLRVPASTWANIPTARRIAPTS